jgi:hypothetical protein
MQVDDRIVNECGTVGEIEVFGVPLWPPYI